PFLRGTKYLSLSNNAIKFPHNLSGVGIFPFFEGGHECPFVCPTHNALKRPVARFAGSRGKELAGIENIIFITTIRKLEEPVVS
ncbi:hypothetical protein, partial [Raoultella planticola]|uniref:hypothetical protein n=1 Tax=Raoultella planticola TaxID=575 RepID=UPI0019530953